MKALFRVTAIATLLVVTIIEIVQAEKLVGDSLIIGKPFPEIVLSNIKHFSSKKVFTKNLKGKWLVLDFWSRGCSACIERFPVMNALQNKYRNKLQVFLIGKSDPQIERMYERFRRRDSLSLPILFDTVLFKKFRIRTVPYIIIIGPDGITRAITIELTDQNFVDFINNKTPDIRPALNLDQEYAIDRSFDLEKPLFISGNGGPDTSFYFRSILGPWTPAMPTMAADFPDVMGNRIQMTGLGIADLYLVAYGDTLGRMPYKKPNVYGEYWPYPIVQVMDTTLFETDFKTGKNLFSYAQTAPSKLVNNKLIKERMQRDLQNYFGYHTHLETRIKPCWNLVVVADSLQNFGAPKAGYVTDENDLYEGPLEFLIAAFWYHNQDQVLFYDETNLNPDLQVRLEVILSDINELNKGLKRYGLALQRGEREVKVVVITDF